MAPTRVQIGAGAGMAPALRFEGVSFTYRGASTPALSGLDLEVAPGEWLALVGGNGSGKSTVARLANGLLVPDEGRVTVDGLDTASSQHLWEIRARVGLLFQDPEDQIVGASVEDDVAFGLENLGVPPQAMRARVARALAAVGLAGEEQTEPHLLSGGQKQRLALAGVLVLEPRVLVLDEPTSMLDPAGRGEVLGWVRWSAEQGVAVVMITQHMDEVLPADRVVALEGGRAVFDGPVPAFFASEVSRRLPLGQPAAPALAEELARLGVPGLAARGRAGAGPEASGGDTTGPEASGGGFSGGRAADREPLLTEDDLVGVLRACVTPVSPGDGRARPWEGPPGTAGSGSASGRFSLNRAGAGAAEAPPPPVIRLEAVRLVYAEGAPFARIALRGADLALGAGEVVAVVGATASGKSSLLQVCAGLLRPTSGTVDFAGRSRPAGGEVGMVFQRAEIQLFCATVEQDVAVAPRLSGVHGEALRLRVDGALRATGLDPESFRERSPHSLSMGERRRVALAGILALDPCVLILDEPGAGLDPEARTRLMTALAEWAHGRDLEPGRDPGTAAPGRGRAPRTLIFTSHDMDEVARLADRVVIMAEGMILADGPTKTVLGEEEVLVRAGLRPPLPARVAARLGARSPRPVTPEDLALWLTRGDRMA